MGNSAGSAVKLPEIARRIGAHLERFEDDPEINTIMHNPSGRTGGGLRRFFNAGAISTGSRVEVRYIGYQGTTKLKKADALAYLAWLDSGGIGKHYDFLRYRFDATSERG